MVVVTNLKVTGYTIAGTNLHIINERQLLYVLEELFVADTPSS